MHLFAVGDDLLGVILTFCAVHKAYIALACRRFRNLLCEHEHPRECRFVNISSIFVSKSCYFYAVENLNVVEQFALYWNIRTREIVQWKPKARLLAYKTAPLDLLRMLFPEDFVFTKDNTKDNYDKKWVTTAVRTGRMELLDNCTFSMEVPWLRFLDYFKNSHDYFYYPILSNFVNDNIRDLVNSPTADAFLRFVDFMGPRTDNHYWKLVFRCVEEGPSIATTSMIYASFRACAASRIGYDALEVMTSLMKYNGVGEHADLVSIFFVTESWGHSASALQWLKTKCGTRDVVDMLNKAIGDDEMKRRFPLFNRRFINAGRCVNPDMRHIFTPNDAETYKTIRDAVAEGGFLRGAFLQTANGRYGHAQYVSLRILNDDQLISRYDASEILLESVYDSLSQCSSFEDLNKTLEDILSLFITQFPYESYMVLRRVAHARPLRGKLFLWLSVSIRECVLRGMSRVLEDAVNRKSLLQLDAFKEADKSCILDCILVANKPQRTIVRMLKTYLPLCAVGENHLLDSVSNNQFEEVRELLEHCTQLQKAFFGRHLVSCLAVCKPAIQIAIDSGCFVTEPSLVNRALQLLQSGDSGETRNKKRKLPFTMARK